LLVSGDWLQREAAYWNARYTALGDEPELYSEGSFRDAVTPAFVPGGSTGGIVHKRALEIVLESGLAGKRLLDYCCGRGKWSMHWTALGAEVHGFDISEPAIAHARARAAANGFAVQFDVADARRLPYANESFDLIVGISALEHAIKYEGSGAEARRVLATGGLAVFTENLGQNPLINFARRFTMRGEEAAGDVLLTERLISDWAAGFSQITIEGHTLLLMAKRVLPNQFRLLRALHTIDESLFHVAPGLRRFGGECVIVLRA